jgi:hypothetical protein
VPKLRRTGRRATTIEVGLTPSGLGDLFRDFDETFSDHITLIAERDEGHSGSPHKSCMAACCQCAGDIPRGRSLVRREHARCGGYFEGTRWIVERTDRRACY